MSSSIKLLLILVLSGAAFGQFGGEKSNTIPAAGGGGTVAFLNANTPVQASATTFSGSMTVNAGGTNVVAFVWVCFDGGTSALSISALTYNGVSIVANTVGAAVHDTTGTDNVWCQAFYYINPPTGAHTLAITGSGTGFSELYANLVAYQGVNQTTPVRSGTYKTCTFTVIGTCTSTNTAANVSMVVSSDTHDLTMSVMEDGDSGSISATNQTSDGINTSGTNAAASDHATTAAATVTHTWTFTATEWAILGFSIQHA